MQLPVGKHSSNQVGQYNNFLFSWPYYSIKNYRCYNLGRYQLLCSIALYGLMSWNHASLESSKRQNKGRRIKCLYLNPISRVGPTTKLVIVCNFLVRIDDKPQFDLIWVFILSKGITQYACQVASGNLNFLYSKNTTEFRAIRLTILSSIIFLFLMSEQRMYQVPET